MPIVLRLSAAMQEATAQALFLHRTGNRSYRRGRSSVALGGEGVVAPDRPRAVAVLVRVLVCFSHAGKIKFTIHTMVFSFGQSELERIEVDVLRYERSLIGEYYDDNWLAVEIRVRVGGFHGKAQAAILTSELVSFALELHPLFETLKGSAEFKTMEEQLSLRLEGDGRGHIELTGEVEDRAGIGNRLHFTLKFDQSELKASIRELEMVTSEFPVRDG